MGVLVICEYDDVFEVLVDIDWGASVELLHRFTILGRG